MKTKTQNKMRIIHSEYGYNFCIGWDCTGKPFYNIIPMGKPTPTSGYYNSQWICKVKNVRNIFKEEHERIICNN
jgi:hypothetical protein